MSHRKIDLNLDAGESPEALKNGAEEALFRLVSSINVACGGHAGDLSTMSAAVDLAIKYRLNIGAHPSFPDRENFGRKNMKMPRENLVQSLKEQIENLKSICEKKGAKLTHVKPHGALYNSAATDPEIASAIIEAVQKVDPTLPVVGLAGSAFLKWCDEGKITPIAEAFADRRYERSGQLRSRHFEDALITDPDLAAEQAVRIVETEKVKSIDGTEVALHADTICVHGDSPQAIATIQRIRKALDEKQIQVHALDWISLV